MPLIYFLLSLLSALWLCGVANGALLLVSFDGFRWDYLFKYRANCSWFHFLRDRGASSSDGSMIPAFLTKTFPGHFTTVTGLYQESHGITANKMFDAQLDANFSISSRSKRDPRWWNGAVPLWITAQMQGKKAATFFWPGSEVSYGGIQQSDYRSYNESIPFRDRVDQAVSWLAESRMDLVTLYFHEPDLSGHQAGPNAQQVQRAVANVNDVVGYLIQKMTAANIFNTTNIVIIADHGMAECTKARTIPLVEKIPQMRHLFKFMVNKDGPFVDFVPEEGKKQELFDFLVSLNKEPGFQNMTVFRKEDLPDAYHYKNHRRVQEVLLLANEGYYIIGQKPKPGMDAAVFGAHGYDNRFRSMRPVFLAHGPGLKAGARVPPFRQVDLYNLLAALAELEPRPNNGSWNNVAELYNGVAPSVCPSLWFLLIAATASVWGHFGS